MSERGVDLSPRSIEALADARRRSDRWFLAAFGFLLLVAIWLLK